ncbi:hypothetical protein ABH922_002574 [Rhodococcus sp. 27YEA15]|uniref:hypothetical protein n=1 Tax=Rhodococcus sp. 27YEA15 TaxID=3156259 RepID=UPI003C7D53C3
MERYVRQEPVPDGSRLVLTRTRSRLERLQAALRCLHPGNLLRDRKASEYSSLTPRHPDGSRTEIMPFNGSGHGR